jgi:mRNA interferase RelE/StbE
MVVFKRILQLGKDPEKQGKALLGDLAGCRSIRAGGRYRVVFTVNRGRVLVVVIAVGMRKEGDQRDIYRLAKKLFRNFLEEKK